MKKSFTADPASQPRSWPRREFFKRAGLAVGVLAFQPWRMMARPFAREDFNHLIPADKKLSAEWVKSLLARGTPEVLRGDELKYVTCRSAASARVSFISAATAGQLLKIFIA